MLQSRCRTVGGFAGGLPLMVIPLNSGKYFSTGSSSDSFPWSARIMTTVAVTGFELDAMNAFWSTARLPKASLKMTSPLWAKSSETPGTVSSSTALRRIARNESRPASVMPCAFGSPGRRS